MSQRSEATPRIAALVLAAGRASRFGSSKLVEKVNGKSLVRQAVELGRSACGSFVLLVVGHDRHAVRDAAGPAATACTINDRYSDGLSTSIRAGVSALEHAADAILLLLADQPAISEAHLAEIIAAFNPERPVASAYGNTIGPPALFPSCAFDELKSLEGDSGAKLLLRELDAITLPFEDGSIDIDSKEDLGRFRQ